MWTEQEFEFINEYMKDHYEKMRYNDSMDFEGNVLVKENGKTLIYSWDKEEIYFKGTLKECLNYIIG